MKATDIDLSRYWRLMKLESGGSCRRLTLAGLQSFVETTGKELLASIPEQTLQSQLLDCQRDRAHPQYSLAALSLRCLISHGIHSVCINLYQQFGEAGSFYPSDLFPLVLTDQGKESPTPQALSLGEDILQTYDRDASTSLLGWTNVRVKRHDPLNQFLVKQGIYRLSDWAILNDTSPYQLVEILGEFYRHSKADVESAIQLLEQYHQVYRASRLRQQQASGKITRCAVPSVEQLQSIKEEQEPNQTLAQLQTLATFLRHYRIFMRGGPPPPGLVISMTREEDGTLIEVESSGSAVDEPLQTDDQSKFLDLYDQAAQASLRKSVATVIQHRCDVLRSKRRPRTQLFIEAMKRFYCHAESMSSIAKTVDGFNGNQTNVTRLLNLKALRADIRQAWLVNLQAEVKDLVAPHLSAERLEALDHQLETILGEQIDLTLVQEKKDSKNSERSCETVQRNLLALCMCDYLQTFT